MNIFIHWIILIIIMMMDYLWCNNPLSLTFLFLLRLHFLPPTLIKIELSSPIIIYRLTHFRCSIIIMIYTILIHYTNWMSSYTRYQKQLSCRGLCQTPYRLDSLIFFHEEFILAMKKCLINLKINIKLIYWIVFSMTG